MQTRRQPPAAARSSGAAILLRAGYWSTEGEPTVLGRATLQRLSHLAQAETDFFEKIHLAVIRTRSGEAAYEAPGGGYRGLRCRTCGYADSLEVARFQRRPPAAEEMLPLHKVATPDCTSIEALASLLGISKARTVKAMMYRRVTDGQFVFVVVRGDTQVSETKLRTQLGDLQPAGREQIEAAGAVMGYASPIGLHDALVIVDGLVAVSSNLVAGANEAGYHVENTNLGRDYVAAAVADLALAKEGDDCPDCGSPLVSFSGLLVQAAHDLILTNVLRALAEQHHDERGLSIPWPATPFAVYLMQIASGTSDTMAAAESLYGKLTQAGISVLFDDRDERAGVKFNDADLIGCPLRLTVGERNLKNGMIELKHRTREGVQLVPLSDAVSAVLSTLEIIQ